jgi:hypothetical protein
VIDDLLCSTHHAIVRRWSTGFFPSLASGGVDVFGERVVWVVLLYKDEFIEIACRRS